MAKKAKHQPARSEFLSAAELKRIRAEIQRRFGTAPTIAELKRGLAAAERRVEARLAARMAALDKRLQAFRKKAEKIAAETQLRMASDTLRYIRAASLAGPARPSRSRHESAPHAAAANAASAFNRSLERRGPCSDKLAGASRKELRPIVEGDRVGKVGRDVVSGHGFDSNARKFPNEDSQVGGGSSLR